MQRREIREIREKGLFRKRLTNRNDQFNVWDLGTLDDFFAGKFGYSVSLFSRNYGQRVRMRRKGKEKEKETRKKETETEKEKEKENETRKTRKTRKRKKRRKRWNPDQSRENHLFDHGPLWQKISLWLVSPVVCDWVDGYREAEIGLLPP